MALTETELALARYSPAGLAYATSAFMDAEGRRRHRWIPLRHLRLLNDRILAAVSGELLRAGKTGLIVSMPPRHGKSELTSRATAAWFLGRFPNAEVMFASYQQRFAESWGRKARDLLEQYGEEIFEVAVSSTSSSAAWWELATPNRGSMSSAGIGGLFTGRGADLLLVDDPNKNAQDAKSAVMREGQWEWWQSTARSRLHGHGVAIIVATRWHEDDLIGRLLVQAREDPEADQWEVINLPAIAEPSEQSGLMEDAVGRSEGDPLCPELGYDTDWAKRTRASVGGYVWHALYQGKPRPAEGLLFKARDFRYFRYEEPSEQYPHGLYVLEGEGGELHPVDPSYCTHFQTADTAASESEMADYTVISTWAVTPVERHLLLVDVRRERFEDTRVGALVAQTYDGQAQRPAFVSVENASSGPKVIRELGNKGYPIRSADPDRDKVTRALLAVARYEEHRVFHRQAAPWLAEWEAELKAFPNAAHDDQVDTVSYAAIELRRINVGRPRRGEQKAKPRTAGLRTREL